MLEIGALKAQLQKIMSHFIENADNSGSSELLANNEITELGRDIRVYSKRNGSYRTRSNKPFGKKTRNRFKLSSHSVILIILNVFLPENREQIKDFFVDWANNFVNVFMPRLKRYMEEMSE